jgi:superfamily II DNA or RNA helicase
MDLLPGKIKLYDHQKKAVDYLRTGSILNGGVGSGKSMTALEYYHTKVPPWIGLYIITTARKRDTKDWESECEKRYLFKPEAVDSWNNIKKYVDIKEAFFIFDEQRVIGSGVWVKSFLKIVKNNDWILLTATPGDTWMDYIPVFIANGFYKNRTEFIKRHVIFNRFVTFPKVDRYLETDRLEKLKQYITVDMEYKKPTVAINNDIHVEYNKDKLEIVTKKRWNPFTEKPIRNAASMVYIGRKVINSDSSRLGNVHRLLNKHRKLVVFYNFNYELEILREFKKYKDVSVSEWNGHKHESIPTSEKWLYLVQYTAGNEGWNCTETNTIIFYSLNYSYRVMVQAAGRIDRVNTPFSKLYYYRLISDSPIDQAILKALKNKKNFNVKRFARKTYTIIEEE